MRRAPPAAYAPVLMGWLTVVLWLDRSGGGGGAGQQRVLGALTWLLLLVVLARVSPTVRVQTLVVVGFATVVEYVSSPLLQVYTYRFDNVPAFVPPGHGLVYLAAYALGHASLLERHRRTAVTVVVVGGGLWASYGLLLSARPDVLGAFWYACLVLFLAFGPSRPVYLGAFVAVGYLELAGTGLGTWTWATHDPTGSVSIGNPPSGAAGGYGWFDLVAILAAGPLLRGWGRLVGQVPQWVSLRVGRPVTRQPDPLPVLPEVGAAR
jgi:hypothetical protein